MNTAIEVIQEVNCLRLEIHGVLNLESAQKATTTAIQKCFETSCLLVLVDITKVDFRLNIIDAYQLAIWLREQIKQFYPRIAIVTIQENLLPDRFFEVVTRNRGIDLRTFLDFDNARTWLTVNK
jgi:hypothetical protein